MRGLRNTLLSLVLIGSVLGSQTALACGGLFSSDRPVAQATERIIFAVNQPAGELSVYLQLNYTGDPADFAWVIPVPNNPKVETASAASFSELDQLTAPRFIFPKPPECFQSRAVGAGAPGAGVAVLQQSSVGPYDFAVLGGEDSQALVAWLRSNGYNLTPAMEPPIKVYTDQKMLFLAMKLTGNDESQTIEPVKMTFKATKPMIPMRMAAIAAEPNTAIETWIFADAQARPENMAGLRINKNDLAVVDLAGSNNYKAVRTEAIDNARTGPGQAFVIEYAQPTSALQASDPLIKELASQHRYVTRLYGEMSPAEMTVDPVFTFDSGLPEVARDYDMSNRVTPYECGKLDDSSDDTLQTVRRQQNDAARGPGRKSPEEATRDLRRGPLRLVSLIVVGLIGLLIFWLVRRRPLRSDRA